MQLRSHTSEPRSKFIARFTGNALRQSGLCIRKFSTRVACEYLDRIATHERTVGFHTGNGSTESAFKAEKRNAQLVQRFLDGTVKFPSDLEESWVDALPEKLRDELIRELAARYGLSATRIPGNESHHPIANLARTLHDAGDLATALSPLFASGKLNQDDIHHMREALPVIARAVTDMTSLQAQMAHAMETKPALRSAS